MFILLIVDFDILYPVKRNIFLVTENGFQAWFAEKKVLKFCSSAYFPEKAFQNSFCVIIWTPAPETRSDLGKWLHDACCLRRFIKVNIIFTKIIVSERFTVSRTIECYLQRFSS